MRRWLARLRPAGSLRRFLLGWIYGGFLTVGLGVTAWYAAQEYRRLALAQDEGLASAVAEVAGDMAVRDTLAINEPVHALASRRDGITSVRLHFRVSAMSGEWLVGEQGFESYIWRHRMDEPPGLTFYVTHIRGELVRAVAAVRHVSGADRRTPVLVQVAAPLGDRFPSAAELLRGPLGVFYLTAAVLAVWMGSGVALATRWLRQSHVTLDRAGEAPLPYAGPSEFEPAVDEMRALYREHHGWVEQQRGFLAEASHQLRTPMAVLRAQLQSALAGDVSPQELLPQLLHTVDRASGLANQLLSISRLEQMKRSGRLPEIEINGVVRDAVIELSPLIAAKRVDFSLEGPTVQAPADATMLGELVRNLLANAIHHVPPSGRLGVLLRSVDRRTELIVWDEGPALDEGVRERLFQPFSASRGGVGLGLSICRQIGESMGATVSLFNRVHDGKAVGVDAVVSWGQGP